MVWVWHSQTKLTCCKLLVWRQFQLWKKYEGDKVTHMKLWNGFGNAYIHEVHNQYVWIECWLQDIISKVGRCSGRRLWWIEHGKQWSNYLLIVWSMFVYPGTRGRWCECPSALSMAIPCHVVIGDVELWKNSLIWLLLHVYIHVSRFLYAFIVREVYKMIVVVGYH